MDSGKSRLVIGILLMLFLFGIFVFALEVSEVSAQSRVESSSFTGRIKSDFGAAGTNASSSSFTQRFIFGAQVVSRYISSGFGGRFGILEDEFVSVINITQPLNAEEIPRGHDSVLGVSNEDDKGIVHNSIDIYARVNSNGTGKGGIPDITVSIYFNDTLIGTNITNATGTANVSYDKSQLPEGVYNISANYSSGSYDTRVNTSSVNISLVSFSIPNGPGNKGVAGVYVDGQTAILYFNITKTNTSGDAFFYEPQNITVNATSSAGVNYPDNAYVKGMRVHNVTVGQYESHVVINKTFASFIKWDIYISENNYTSYAGSAIQSDVEIGDPPICGNTLLESPEQCDDGNTVAGDGCSAACLSEGGGGEECTDDCVDGSVLSVCIDGDTLGTQTCGDYDADSCTEWSAQSSNSCAVGESCVAAECVPSVCTEDWTCGDWSQCTTGTQTRTCTDNNACGTEVNKPAESQACTVCVESWTCEYTVCGEGDATSTPFNCVDANACGTTQFQPSAVSCGSEPQEQFSNEAGDKCTPTFVCSGWSGCDATYGLEDILENPDLIGGTQTRTCVDSTGSCASDRVETRSCEARSSVNAKVTEWCNENYVEIYDEETGKLVSRIKEAEILQVEELSRVDVSLITSEFLGFCEYCSDGVKNYDETGVDCGGPSCSECVPEGIFVSYLFWLIWIFWALFMVSLIMYNIERKREERRGLIEAERGIGLVEVLRPISATEEKRRERKIVRWFAGLFGKKLPRKKIEELRAGEILERRPGRVKPNLFVRFGRAWNAFNSRRRISRAERVRLRAIERETGVARMRRVKVRVVSAEEKMLAELKSKLRAWKREGYYGTNELEAKIARLETRIAGREKKFVTRVIAGYKLKSVERARVREARRIEKARAREDRLLAREAARESKVRAKERTIRERLRMREEALMAREKARTTRARSRKAFFVGVGTKVKGYGRSLADIRERKRIAKIKRDYEIKKARLEAEESRKIESARRTAEKERARAVRARAKESRRREKARVREARRAEKDKVREGRRVARERVRAEKVRDRELRAKERQRIKNARVGEIEAQRISKERAKARGRAEKVRARELRRHESELRTRRAKRKIKGFFLGIGAGMKAREAERARARARREYEARRITESLEAERLRNERAVTRAREEKVRAYETKKLAKKRARDARKREKIRMKERVENERESRRLARRRAKESRKREKLRARESRRRARDAKKERHVKEVLREHETEERARVSEARRKIREAEARVAQRREKIKRLERNAGRGFKGFFIGIGRKTRAMKHRAALRRKARETLRAKAREDRARLMRMKEREILRAKAERIRLHESRVQARAAAKASRVRARDARIRARLAAKASNVRAREARKALRIREREAGVRAKKVDRARTIRDREIAEARRVRESETRRREKARLRESRRRDRALRAEERRRRISRFETRVVGEARREIGVARARERSAVSGIFGAYKRYKNASVKRRAERIRTRAVREKEKMRARAEKARAKERLRIERARIREAKLKAREAERAHKEKVKAFHFEIRKKKKHVERKLKAMKKAKKIEHRAKEAKKKHVEKKLKALHREKKVAVKRVDSARVARIAQLKRQLAEWKKQGYYGTAKLENEIRRLEGKKD